MDMVANPSRDYSLVHNKSRFFYFNFTLTAIYLITEPLEYIQSTLELIQATQELIITDQSLDKQMSQPLFKALQHQSNLESIDLSNNLLEDESLNLLATILPTLPRLKHLNLAGNHITRDGITILASVTANNFPNLESLDFSFNPLTNSSIPSLDILLTNTKNLKKLSLCATEMTDLPNPSNESFKYSQMTDVDFSFNQMKLQNLNKILKKLNSCRMVSLNLAYSCSDRGVVESIVAFLNAGTCEKLRDLNLSGLDLEDADIWMLSQALERAKNLNTLRLMENRRLSSITFKLLMERLSVKTLELDGCLKIYSRIGDNVFVNGQSSISTIRLTVDPLSKVQDLEWINTIWTRMFGERANVKVRHNCIQLTVNS